MRHSSIPTIAMARNWLEAHADFSAGVHTFGQCMALADLNADGDHRLIIADHGLIMANRSQAKLKVIYIRACLFSLIITILNYFVD